MAVDTTLTTQKPFTLTGVLVVAVITDVQNTGDMLAMLAWLGGRK